MGEEAEEEEAEAEAEEEEAAAEESEPEEEPEPEPEPEPVPVPKEDDTMSVEEEKEREEVTSQPRLSVPKISAPRLPEGELVDLDDITRKRREKDLIELQALIASHFEQRQKDEEALLELKNRIEQRKQARAEQAKIRQEKEKQRMAQEREERKKKEEEEEKKREEEEARKKAAIANMSLHYGGYLARAEKNKPNKRQTDREIKKKYLAENKKALNIDHLQIRRRKIRLRTKNLSPEIRLPAITSTCQRVHGQIQQEQEQSQNRWSWSWCNCLSLQMINFMIITISNRSGSSKQGQTAKHR